MDPSSGRFLDIMRRIELIEIFHVTKEYGAEYSDRKILGAAAFEGRK